MPGRKDLNWRINDPETMSGHACNMTAHKIGVAAPGLYGMLAVSGGITWYLGFDALNIELWKRWGERVARINLEILNRDKQDENLS